jgi:hypothetical protein
MGLTRLVLEQVVVNIKGGGVGEVVLEHGFWGLAECGFLIGWSAFIPSMADGVWRGMGWIWYSLLG